MRMNRRQATASGLVVLAAFFIDDVRAAVITFDAIANETLQYFPSYEEAGYRFTSSISSSTAFASWGTIYPDHTGSQALFNDKLNEVTTLKKIDGGVFRLDSIDLSELYSNQVFQPTTVTFIGALADGTNSSFAIDLDLVFGNQHVDFGATFAKVTAVSWTQTYYFHQFDNLVVHAASGVAPEPGTLALVSLALCSLVWIGRSSTKRRSISVFTPPNLWLPKTL